MIEYMSNFMTGLNIGYDATPSHQFNLQILNSLNGSFVDTYGPVPNLEETKLPLVYTLNWCGNFNNVFKTRWSASIMNQPKGEKMTYIALGNELSLGKFGMFLDFMYSKEDIDRKRIMTSMLGQDASLPGAEYMSIVTKLNYRFTPNWNVFVKGMYETASLDKKVGEFADGKYRTSLGYFAGLEYYPMENSNLHFFLTYVGRKYNYTNKVDLQDYDTNRVSVGFIYQLQMF